MKYSRYDAVIVGSGISGLFLANKLAESNSLKEGILLVTKEKLFSGSSALAQGGIVSVIPEINNKDSIESHIKDTLKAGCGLNNLSAVKFVSQESAFAAQELMRFGVEFDKNDKNMLNFTLEGAHSCPRILHANGDSTGRIIEETLCQRIQENSSIEVYENTIAVELLIDSANACKGLILFDKNNKTFEAAYSSNVILATGGIGQIYKDTTNPIASTGDGIALAYNSGAKVENMEFVQFHPTALYCKGKKTMPLVSESTRGEGAKLVDVNGEYFAKKYHQMADLAPRDVVARAIKDQMRETNSEYVNLDISQIGIEKFRRRFPTITSLCNENNIDLSTGLIPVVPAEHYFMGGIKVDLNSKTNIPNLFAIGECASTGLHGANRLASNSLLECVVFAQQLSELILNSQSVLPKKTDSNINEIIEKYSNIEINSNNSKIYLEMFDKLKSIMSEKVAISRTQRLLNEANEQIIDIEMRLKNLDFAFDFNKYELQNAICIAKLIIKAAIERKNSIGAHFRVDYPHKALENKERSVYNDKILVK